MANLTIRYSYGSWYMSANNSSGPGYYFRGATAEDQFVNVQRLQNAMTQGQAQVEGELAEILDRVEPGQEGEIMEELFEGTTELIFETTDVYLCEEGADLLIDIAQAGEALAALL